MDIPQIYLFTGPLFLKHANEFLRDNNVRQFGFDCKIRTSETYVALIMQVKWSMCEEIWQVYLTYANRK